MEAMKIGVVTGPDLGVDTENALIRIGEGDQYEAVYRVTPVGDDDMTLLKEIVRRAVAAPDLLEALQDVQKSVIAQHGETFMRDYTYTVEISGETIGVIVRAIAKAKGGAA